MDDAITAAELRNEAALMERAVLNAKLGTPEEVAACAPGGSRNTAGDTARGWWRAVILLNRLHARGEGHHEHTGLEDEVVLRALASRPKRVALPGALEAADGPFGEILVYPKSLVSILEMQRIDHMIEWLAVRILAWTAKKQAGEALTAEDLDGLTLAEGDFGYYQQLACWGATHPGVRLPWDPDRDTIRTLTPPPAITGLSLLDTLQIQKGYLELHRSDLHYLEALLSGIPETATTGRLPRRSWSVFVSTAAAELGFDPEVMARDWALPKLCAHLKLATAARRDAQQSEPTEAAA